MTRDERFLVELFLLTQNSIDEGIDSLEVGKKLGYKEKLIYNILRGLMQANFVKRVDDDAIKLTPQGLALVKDLMLK